MRARLIKPGFYKSDALAELPPLARILFSGLWCLADRAGRLKDRPKVIKAEVLPYDDCDVEGYLSELAAAGFIERYEAAGRRYIQVVTFARHQSPHIREALSTIPAPCQPDDSTMPGTPVPITVPDPMAPTVPKPRAAARGGAHPRAREEKPVRTPPTNRAPPTSSGAEQWARRHGLIP